MTTTSVLKKPQVVDHWCNCNALVVTFFVRFAWQIYQAFKSKRNLSHTVKLQLKLAGVLYLLMSVSQNIPAIKGCKNAVCSSFCTGLLYHKGHIYKLRLRIVPPFNIAAASLLKALLEWSRFCHASCINASNVLQAEFKSLILRISCTYSERLMAVRYEMGCNKSLQKKFTGIWNRLKIWPKIGFWMPWEFCSSGFFSSSKHWSISHLIRCSSWYRNSQTKTEVQGIWSTNVLFWNP